MRKVQYGSQTIDYKIQEKSDLKSHYITVDRDTGVTLRGAPVAAEKADKLVLQRARWIMEKMNLVKSIGEDDIVTGSRMLYLGRRYYVQLILRDDLQKIEIEFNASKFKVYTPSLLSENQEALRAAFVRFMREKAVEKIAPRVFKISRETGLEFNQLKFRKLEKRWGSCTAANNIILNYEAIKLPFSLIDYLIVHELTHTRVKNHSKEFWAELGRYVSDWRVLDEKMAGMRL